MRTKLVYVMEREDVEILRKAKGIINILNNAADVEYDSDTVETDVLCTYGGIEELIMEDECECCKSAENSMYCERCGQVIEDGDETWVHTKGVRACVCAECVDDILDEDNTAYVAHCAWCGEVLPEEEYIVDGVRVCKDCHDFHEEDEDEQSSFFVWGVLWGDDRTGCKSVLSA